MAHVISCDQVGRKHEKRAEGTHAASVQGMPDTLSPPASFCHGSGSRIDGNVVTDYPLDPIPATVVHSCAFSNLDFAEKTRDVAFVQCRRSSASSGR
jgi:hypothetical protein